jgi:hypothetical protein
MKKLFALLAAALTFTSTAFAEIGSLSRDLVFTPVTPCRIMDTRNPGTKSGILAAGSTRGFFGWAPVNYSAQGGAATNCGSLLGTANATILVNFTVVTPDTGGFITAFPADVLDANRPLAATVNFTAGSVVGNNATIKLNQTGTGEDDFKIFTTSNVHVVADIVGYYSRPVATALECVTVKGSQVVTALADFNVSPAACTAGYTLTGSSCRSLIYNVVNWAVTGFFGTASAVCSGTNLTASTQTVEAYAICCRIPGR